MRVYLDNCCYNRPFDDQSNLIVVMETESKLLVQKLIKDRKIESVWSSVLDYENNDNPFDFRREKIQEWKTVAAVDVEMNEEILECARNFMKRGLRQKDSSHIACALFAHADYFLTVDKKILNKPIAEIEVMSPIDFVRRILHDD